MESESAIFGGGAFCLFGAAVTLWTTVRLWRHEPVALGVNRIASATLASAAGIASLGLGAYCLTRL
ncbi:hypothetical protein [Streptomyces sp. NPDC047028]|uniref:hypothetical protein n=1 Tax=Streptomyces sp. NPDC047028 TaxID=3155793 RepID=UPI0033FD7A5A